MIQEVATDQGRKIALKAAMPYIHTFTRRPIDDFRFELFKSSSPRVEILTDEGRWRADADKIDGWASKLKKDHPRASLITFTDINPFYLGAVIGDSSNILSEEAFTINESFKIPEDVIRLHVKKIIKEISGDGKNSLRPRWAEELRPKRQVKLRLVPELIEQVDDAAKLEGVSRNDWIESAIRKSLEPTPKR